MEPHTQEGTITVYGHPACPMLPPVLGMLKRSKVRFEYVNIHRDTRARQRVREINDGYESVPTLVFPDGSTLTEPASGELKRKLEALGYHVPLSAQLIANLPFLLILAGIILAVLSALGVF